VLLKVRDPPGKVRHDAEAAAAVLAARGLERGLTVLVLQASLRARLEGGGGEEGGYDQTLPKIPDPPGKVQ
jgi:hypothetical protein